MGRIGTNFDKGLYVYGVPILPDTGGVQTTGNIFFVDSGNVDGADDVGTKGKTKDNPFVTVDYAINQTTANNGDVIFVLPGHTETLNSSGALIPDVAGVAIIGLGWGPDRPRFNVSTSGSNETRIGITGAGTWIKNCIFRANSTAIGSSSVGLRIAANDVKIEGCLFDHNSTLSYFANTIEVAGGISRVKILGNEFYNKGTTGQSLKAIDMRSTSATQLFTMISGNIFKGTWTRAVILGSSESSFSQTDISYNRIRQCSTIASDPAIDVNSSKVVENAGYIYGNWIGTSASGAVTVSGIVFSSGWVLTDNKVNISSTTFGSDGIST